MLYIPLHLRVRERNERPLALPLDVESHVHNALLGRLEEDNIHFPRHGVGFHALHDRLYIPSRSTVMMSAVELRFGAYRDFLDSLRRGVPGNP